MAGCEWVVDAHGCDPSALADPARLTTMWAELSRALQLHPVADPLWHQFPGPGGITGICLLAESHFACHTFPEHGSVCINLFCCRERPDWDFAGYLEREFGAADVRVRRLERPFHRT